MELESQNILSFDNSIRDPVKIARIMKKISDASIPVVIRIEGVKPISIRARASSGKLEIDRPHLVLEQLSWRADQILAKYNEIRVDLIGMAASVHFFTSILSRSEGHLVIAHPTKIESVERRANRRALITATSPQCYLVFAFEGYSQNSPVATPVMNHCSYLAQYVRAADISVSGACLHLRFPEIVNFLRPGTFCEKAELRLPLQPSFPISLKVCWVRKIRERAVDGQEDHMTREFRIGVEFQKVEPTLKSALANYMRRIEVGDVV